MPYFEAVSVTCTADNGAVGSLTVYDESSSSAFTFCNPSKPESDAVTAKLRPGKRYTLNFGAFNNPVSYTYGVSFIEPDGYAVYVDGLPSNLITKTVTGTTSQNYTVELRPIGSQQPRPLASFSGIDIGRAVSWEVGLGTRQNGDYAGQLVFREKDLGSSSNPAARARLYYAMPGSYGEIEVFYDAGSSNTILRQIAVPHGVVDLVDNGASAYWIKFYPWSQATGSPGNPYVLSGSPWKTIYVESAGTNQLKVTETEGTVSRVSQLALTSGNFVTSGTYLWTLQEGDNSSNWLRTTTHTGSEGTGYRDDTTVVRTGGATGTIVAKTKYRYEPQSWGDDALTQIIADPDGAALTKTFTYYSTAPVAGDDAERGNFRRVKVATEATGNWTVYRYYDDWARRGQLKYEQRPFVDAPASPPSTIDPTSSTSGQVLFRDYGPDWNGRSSRLVLHETTINSVLTAKSTFVYGDIVGFGWPRETVTQTSYRDATSTEVDYREIYRGDAGFDEPLKPYITKPANGTQTSFASDIGGYNAGTGVFSYNSSNTNRRDLVVHGSAGTGQYSNNLAGQGYYPVYLSPNRSTLDATIRDKRGLPIRTEQWVYISGLGTFSLLTYTNNTFDDAGRLTQSVTNTSATTTYVYTYGRLTSITDASGTENQNTFDGLGRVATSIKKGAPQTSAALTTGYNYAAQGDITNTLTYDGADNVTQSVISSGTLTQTTSRAFDLAGRLTQQVDPGSYTTGYAYSAGGKIATVTLPGSATKVTEVYRDGRLKAVSGTAVVAEEYTYSIDGAGRLMRQQILGGITAGFVNWYWDWLGRAIEEWRPGWNGSNVGNISHYNSSGQIWKYSRPCFADTLYVYDSLGTLYRQGLDLNANGQLDSAGSDRITETTNSHYLDGSSRGTTQTISKMYATTSSGTATTTGTVTNLLSGLGSNLLWSATSQDIFGNSTLSNLSIDPTNKKITATVATPDSSVGTVRVWFNGLLVESRDSSGNITKTEYDGLGRPVKIIDPRAGGTTSTYLGATNLVSTVTDPASITIATYTYDSAGRVSTMSNGLGKVARYAYTARGEKYREWGDTPYPVEYGYDTVGRITTMKTYRPNSSWDGITWPSTPGTADTTTWSFDAATGLLASKSDAAGNATNYTYTQAGQVATRTYARGVVTSYEYSLTGEQTKISYSDSTPTVIYTYDRRGGISTVADYTGTRTFDLCLCGKISQEALGSTFYSGRVLNYKMDASTIGAVGRTKGYTLGTTASPTSDSNVDYTFDAYGRFANVSAVLAGVSAASYTYGYAADSNLIATLTETVSSLLQSRTYEAHRDLVMQYSSALPSRNLATYLYTNDDLGRRISKVETGELFSRYGSGIVTKYGYNARSEVISSQTYLGTSLAVDTAAAGNALQGRSFYYGYDSIGNRQATTTNGQSSSYSTNNLNQIVSRSTPAFADVAGAAASNATVLVGGQTTTRQFDYFYRQHPVDNPYTDRPFWTNLSVSATAPGATSASENRFFYLAKPLEQFTYDLDGNLLSDGRWDYTWDAENRLTSMTITSVAQLGGLSPRSLQFRYDYLGRRVEKMVYDNGASTATTHIRFIYGSGDWNLLAEYDGLNSNAMVRVYAWGLDLSHSQNGAGGVGGLLVIRDVTTSTTYLPTYDANGNVFSLVVPGPGTGTIAATYEYSAFGETIRATGTFADKNPFRYSAKYTDSETQLIYYGYRFYNPGTGRFLGRDPIEEHGGKNLYGFLGNSSPVNSWDLLGLTENCTTYQPDDYEGWDGFTLTIHHPKAVTYCVNTPDEHPNQGTGQTGNSGQPSGPGQPGGSPPPGDSSGNPTSAPKAGANDQLPPGIWPFLRNHPVLAAKAAWAMGSKDPGFQLMTNIIGGRLFGLTIGALARATTWVRALAAESRVVQFTFRGDTRAPATIFKEGFTARGSSTDLLSHALDNTRPPSAFVSTSKSAELANTFADNVYVVRARSGIDVNEVLGPRSPFPSELEVAVPFRIAPTDVRAVTLPQQGVSILNPNWIP
ncbi:MAG: RHS repeat-associated core domain-containing protein [Opitutus sp.]